eukprot:scaffold8804_cov115-Isochrysis_galbana.AAC.9
MCPLPHCHPAERSTHGDSFGYRRRGEGGGHGTSRLLKVAQSAREIVYTIRRPKEPKSFYIAPWSNQTHSG